MTDKEYYTLAEVAKKTRLALTTLQRDARAGKFEHIHRGRTRVMTQDQIDALLEASTTRIEPDIGADDLALIRARVWRRKAG